MPTNEYMRIYMADRRAKRRTILRERLGGKCVRCGAVDDLQFDHVIPATKAFQISDRQLDGPWERLLAEVDKCQLLCGPCHIQKTAEDRSECPHGAWRHRRYGCRCVICEEARKAEREQWNEKRRQQRKQSGVG